MRNLFLPAIVVLGLVAVPNPNTALHANPAACSNCLDLGYQFVEQGYMTPGESAEWMLLCYDTWNCHEVE